MRYPYSIQAEHGMSSNYFERLRKWLFFWKWTARMKCHFSIAPCQYIDLPNDNSGP